MSKAVGFKISLLLGVTLFSCGQSGISQGNLGLIDGRVTCNDGNVPARGASVQLIPLASLLPSESAGCGSSQKSPATSSDLNGVYVLPSVEPGTYIVNATMAGYEDDLALTRTALKRSAPDQRRSILAAFPQVTIKAGGSAHQDLILRRAGAISGRVSVDSGGTIPQSRVLATLVASDRADSEAPTEHSSLSQSAVTDDRGVYRIAGLPAGNYRVSVHVAESFYGTILGGPEKVTVVPQRMGLAELTVFAPEALAPSDAKPIKVAEGDEASDVDIIIPTRSLHSLAGTVTRGGEPLGRVTLSLEIEGRRVTNSDALPMPNGSFQFDLLPDGKYSLIAKTHSSGGAISTTVYVELHGSDATNLVVDLPKSLPKQ